MSELDFKKLNLKDEYRTDSSNIVDEFYIPCLSLTKTYSRATGYFSSESLSITAKGLTKLIKNNGKMRLIASPDISIEDAEAIQKGLKTKKQVLLDVCKLEDSNDSITGCRLAFLEHLISSGRLEVKLALRLNEHGFYGIYHEKIGIFEDELGNIISFTGSNNETAGGLKNNFESCNVFCSWDSGVTKRASSKKNHFEELWRNKASGLEIIDFTEETASQLIKFRSQFEDKDPEEGLMFLNKNLMEKKTNKPMMPPPTKFQLRDYQKEAIKNWFERDGVGFFEMCTGSGKTKTAISALSLTYEYSKQSLFVLIIAPYQHLVTQWTEELGEFNISPIQIMGDSKKWIPVVSQRINDFNSGALDFCCLISTNASFGTDKFHELTSRIKGNFLLIADEAHNLGSEKALSYLPENANYRIGLSATPKRHYDEEGTNSLMEYFGERVAQFTLKDALDNDFLTKYFYHVVPVYLDIEESKELERLSESIERLSVEIGKPDFSSSGKNKILESILFKRARLIASAKEKLPKLKEIVSKNLDEIKNALFYCGDGSLVDEESNLETRQIELVTKLLGDELGLNVHRFTSEESLEERKKITEMFIRDDLDALIAIRCLDEGVDIPKIKVAFLLASTTNPKQFIQRRGRVLRKFEGKKFSTIYDFLVLPNPSIVSFKYAKSLLIKEFERINEFADLAINGPEAVGQLRDIKNQYNLMDR